ncbi:ABC transporter permease [Puia dinghuensis]|uniref:ABC transporter permease n=1 Tax=Puia dinghuensis TaxID=1792502 RepID=A0A8J2XU16_9BACT|nr:ABC transporter permease [Puia dinghuensis]
MRLIWGISRKWTTLTLVLIAVESVLYLLLLYIFKHLINEVARSTPFNTEKVQRVEWYLAVITAGTIIYVVVKALSTLATEINAQRVKESIDEKIHECAVNLDLAFYESPAYFDTMKRARDAGPEAPNNVVLNLADIAKNCLTLVAIGSILISISWLLLPLLALFIAPTLLVRIRYAEQLYQWRRRQTPVERQATYLSDLLTEDTSAKEIRGYGLGAYIRGLYTGIRLGLMRERLQMTRRNTFKELLTNIMATLGLFACIAYLCFSLIKGRISVGDMSLFLIVFPQSYGILQGMAQGISGLYQNNIFINNLFELFDLRATLKEPEHPLPFPESDAVDLEVENMSFTYPHAKEPALRNVSLRVPSGKIVAIVGLNGAGKTTLIKLLCRLYDPSEGSIKMDGTDIRCFRSTEYRKHISAVFQDFGRFNITAAENIRWGDIDGERPESEIESASRKSGAHDYIRRFPEGYGTMMGRLFENGREVSIGQWQKLAIARSFYSNSRFVIFDEATSALDAVSEDELFQSFRQRIGNRAALIISHRLSAVRHADHIYVMGEGRVQQHGTHEELVAMGGTYAKLFLKKPVESDNAGQS